MHIAVFCPAFPSHVAAADAIGAALVERGHRVTLVQRPEARGWLAPRSPLGFAPLPAVGEASLEAVMARAARPAFPFGVRRVINDAAAAARNMARHGASVLADIGAEAALVDQMAPGGAIAAERAGLPFVSWASALPVEEEPTLPPPTLGWRYDPSPRGIRRNAGGARVAEMILRPLGDALAAEGDGARRRLPDWVSPLASLWQLVPGLDLPRQAPPATAHYVGPLRLGAEAGALAFVLPSDRPVVYASLGTLQGHRVGLFRRIARACRRIEAFLVVSHCGRLTPEQAAGIDADVVVADLPQRAMLARADAVVSHAGLNTALDAAEAGVPVLALPIAFDQPGCAARLVWSGLGRALDPRFATAGRIARALDRLLSDRRHRDAGRRLAAQVAEAGGAARAAAIAEQALASRRPVRRRAA
jgi:zeaxanthin glucosyltransferase